MKDLKYYKDNCEEDYLHTPISVLRYITELEKEVESKPLIIDSVVGQSEKLLCNCGFNPSTFQLETGEICCCNCEKIIAYNGL